MSERVTVPARRPAPAASLARFALAALLAALGACAPLPPQPPPLVTTLPAEPRPSLNFDARRPNFVVIHHTSSEDVEHSLDVLTRPSPGVSAHYVIARDGRIYHLVDERYRAWHAGESHWGGHRDLNSASIGIELDNNGQEPFAEPQIVSLLALLADLKTRYKIPAANFLGHGDVAPGRKVDPSALFPWRRLAGQGFGVWCDPPYPAAPHELDTATMLQAFGYNVWNLDAAVAAFKRRFAPDDPSPEMTERDRSVLYCLLTQVRALAAQ
ncbi:MAG: N-acetylmuramoyl-L-alanine amidase [Burkholderiales bacterium]